MKKSKSAGIIIQNTQAEILLILRDNISTIPYPNQWDIPGGSVEKDESFNEAIVREMKEEIGINLKNFKLIKVYEWPENTEYIYYAKIDLVPKNLKLNEGQKIQYFKVNDILKINLAFHGNEIFKDLIKNNYI